MANRWRCRLSSRWRSTCTEAIRNPRPAFGAGLSICPLFLEIHVRDVSDFLAQEPGPESPELLNRIGHKKAEMTCVRQPHSQSLDAVYLSRSPIRSSQD